MPSLLGFGAERNKGRNGDPYRFRTENKEWEDYMKKYTSQNYGSY
jgi:hypothetical protein